MITKHRISYTEQLFTDFMKKQGKRCAFTESCFSLEPFNCNKNGIVRYTTDVDLGGLSKFKVTLWMCRDHWLEHERRLIPSCGWSMGCYGAGIT